MTQEAAPTDSRNVTPQMEMMIEDIRRIAHKQSSVILRLVLLLYSLKALKKEFIPLRPPFINGEVDLVCVTILISLNIVLINKDELSFHPEARSIIENIMEQKQLIPQELINEGLNTCRLYFEMDRVLHSCKGSKPENN
jgi:hypothetical protein